MFNLQYLLLTSLFVSICLAFLFNNLRMSSRFSVPYVWLQQLIISRNDVSHQQLMKDIEAHMIIYINSQYIKMQEMMFN